MEQYTPFFKTNEPYVGRRGSGVFEPQTNYLLSEKLHNIQKDVDFIYNHSFKEFIDDYHSKNLKPLTHYLKDSRTGDFNFFRSSDLQTADCKLAHKEIPLNIYCGIYLSSSYSFSNNNEIVISLKKDLIDLMYGRKPNENPTIDYSVYFPNTSSKNRRAVNEMSEGRIKASIAHELAHWVDDAKYKIFSRIIGDETDSRIIRELLKLNVGYVDLTYFEIQSQIHGIEQLKNSLGSKWDTLSLNELFELYTPLADIIENIHREFNKDIALIWVKAIIKRMNREHLLGKNMKGKLDMLNLRDVSKIVEQCYHPYRI